MGIVLKWLRTGPYVVAVTIKHVPGFPGFRNTHLQTPMLICLHIETWSPRCIGTWTLKFVFAQNKARVSCSGVPEGKLASVSEIGAPEFLEGPLRIQSTQRITGCKERVSMVPGKVPILQHLVACGCIYFRFNSMSIVLHEAAAQHRKRVRGSQCVVVAIIAIKVSTDYTLAPQGPTIWELEPLRGP